jgi:hypothetical protein
MEKQRKFILSVPGVALITILILLVPFVSMQFTDEVNWSVMDFILMGALLFGTGMLLMLVARLQANIVYRMAMALGIGTTFLMIWANLAVGLIGSGPHAGNLMYMGVIAVLIIGTYASRFRAAGMERAMFAASLSFLALAGIALAAGMHQYSGSSVIEILGVNVFFATPYAVAGLLFRYVALEEASAA